tara:strand:+ start:167 stop:517 length:351 start_codon:yes stop_codon:yes gene_type:complete
VIILTRQEKQILEKELGSQVIDLEKEISFLKQEIKKARGKGKPRGIPNPANLKPYGPGEENKNAKLTWEIVNEIRSKATGGKGESNHIAEKYKISRSQANRILKNESWIDQNFHPS